jgi:hypothetical protein
MSSDAPADVIPHSRPHEWEADWLLGSWARVIERLSADYPEFGLGVTLNVGGSSYSGLLVSGGRWADEMARMLHTRSVDHRIGRALAESFEDERERYRRPDFSAGPLRFLHLLHAALVDSRGERTGEGLPMRFRLDAVAAWAIAGWAVGSSSGATADFHGGDV